MWAVPVVVIGLVAAWATRQRGETHGPRRRRAALVARLARPAHLEAGLICGFASSLYFGTNAFLPDYLAARGPRRPAGPRALGAQLGADSGLGADAASTRARLTRRRWPFVALGIAGHGVAGRDALPCPTAWFVFWSGVLGFCNAFMLILTLALPPLIAKPEDVSRLAAAMIAIGYLCAFLVPIAGGALWDAHRDSR